MDHKMRAIVGARISEFKRKMAEVHATMRKTATSVVVNVKVKHKEAQNRLNGIANTIRSLQTVGANIGQGSLIAVSPATIPILASIAGGLGAVSTYFAMAGSAALAFGAVAIPTITKLFDENAKLTAQQKAARGEFEKVGKTWRGIVKDLETPVLSAFSEAMRITNKVLQMARPLFDSATTAVNNLLKSLNTSMDSAPIRAFFDYMNKNAGPMLETFGKTIGNFTKGIMSMMVAFGPLAEDFAAGFLKMSKRFAEWAAGLSKSEKFQSFISYVRENGPKVLSLIGNLANFLVSLGVALAPMGSKMLDFVNGIIQWTTKMMENHPWIGKLIAGIVVIAGVFQMLTPLIIMAGTLFSGFGGTLMKLLAKATIWAVRMAAQWLVAMGPIGWIILAVGALVAIIIAYWDEIKAWTIKTWNKVWTWIKETWEKIKAGTTAAAKAVWSAVKNKFSDMYNAVKDKMNDAWNKIKEIWDKVKTFFEDIDLKQVGKDIIQGLINGIGAMKDKVTKKIKEVAGNIKDTITGWLDVHSPSRFTDWVGRMYGKGLVNGISSMIKPVTAIASKMAQAAMINPLQGPSMAGMDIGMNPALAGGAIGGAFEHTMKSTTPSRYESKSKDQNIVGAIAEAFEGMVIDNRFAIGEKEFLEVTGKPIMRYINQETKSASRRK